MTTGSVQDREHKLFSPSQSERFILCPGSVNLIRRTLPRGPTEYSLEGTVAHTVLEAGLRNECENATQAIDNSIYCMTPEVFDVDFKAAINDALDYIWELYWNLEYQYGDCVIYIERFVNPPVASAPGEAAGFCDVAIYSPSARRLWVIDYKHGVGVPKDVDDNTQAKQYAAGFLFEENAMVDPANIDIVTLVIIQPRAFHPKGPIREYNASVAEIYEYLGKLDEHIELCLQPDAPLVPGYDQCRFCPARDQCPAAEKHALAIPGTNFKDVKDVTVPKLPHLNTLDVDRISYIMQMWPYIKLWYEGVESRAEELMRLGNRVPGFKLVEAQARREWFPSHGEKPDEFAARLAASIGCEVDEIYPRKLITITEAEKKIVEAFKSRVGRGRKKQAAEEAAQTFAYFTLKKSSGNLTMVSDEDARPAVDKAIMSFSGIAGLIPQPPTTKD